MSMLSLALKNSRARLFAQPSFTSQIAKFSSAQVQLQASGATNPADPEYRSGNDRYHEYGQYLMSLMPKYVQQFTVYKDELTLHVAPSGLIPACRILRDHSGCQFKQLVDIAGVDFPHRNNRFELVYNFLSIVNSTRIKVKTYADEVSPVPSLSDLFKSSIWFEREVYDMYGVFFTNHPDLRRILTDYGFMGYPLRKDFPLTGYVEVRYDEERKRVVTEPLELAQAFRSFDYSSAWEQTGPGRPDFPKSLPKQEKSEN